MNLQDAVKLLQEVAKRGFVSEPVPHWLNKGEKEQVISFTDEEKKEMRKFLGDNQHLSKLGRHEIGSMFGETSHKTISLLGRISYAMSSNNISPDYVSGLATELEETDSNPLWEIAMLNKMVN